ncbi:MAG: hypothetical protein LC775_14185, partial [Acidobacteria bacterium]|nr:hypothetical protein [Acidobacteriota bacterium]
HAPQRNQPKYVRENPREFDPVIVKPNSMQRISLGRYRESDTEPQFTIQYEPDIEDSMVHKLIRFRRWHYLHIIVPVSELR